MRLASGVNDQYIYFVAVDATDFVTRETGLSSFTVYRSRNGAAAASYTTPTINETDVTNMPGVYELLVDEDVTIDSGDETQEICLHITHAGMAPVTRTIELYRPKVTAGETITVSGGAVGTVAAVTTVNALANNSVTAASTAADFIAEIKAQVVAALATDTYAEPTGVPASTDDLAAKIGRIYQALMEKIEVTASEKLFYDNGGSPLWKKNVSNDGTTYSETQATSP